MSKCFAFSRFLFAFNISPAFENTLSEGTEVAGIIEYFVAISNNGSNNTLCFCQKSRGRADRFSRGRLIYWEQIVCALVINVTFVLS